MSGESMARTKSSAFSEPTYSDSQKFHSIKNTIFLLNHDVIKCTVKKRTKDTSP